MASPLPPTPPLWDALIGMIAPGALAALAAFIATRGATVGRLRAGFAVLAAGAVYAAARWMLWGWFGWWPVSVFPRLALVALGLGLVLAAVAACGRVVRWPTTVLAAILAVAAIALRDGGGGPLVALGFGVGAGVLAILAECAASRFPFSTLAALAAATTAASLGFHYLGSSAQAQAQMIVSAILGGSAAAALLTKRAPSGVAAFAVILLGTALVADWRFGSAELPIPLLVLGLAPLGLGLGLLPPLRERGRLAASLAVAGVLIIALVGGVLAFRGGQAEDSGSSGYGYGAART